MRLKNRTTNFAHDAIAFVVRLRETVLDCLNLVDAANAVSSGRRRVLNLGCCGDEEARLGAPAWGAWGAFLRLLPSCACFLPNLARPLFRPIALFVLYVGAATERKELQNSRGRTCLSLPFQTFLDTQFQISVRTLELRGRLVYNRC